MGFDFIAYYDELVEHEDPRKVLTEVRESLQALFDSRVLLRTTPSNPTLMQARLVESSPTEVYVEVVLIDTGMTVRQLHISLKYRSFHLSVMHNGKPLSLSNETHIDREEAFKSIIRTIYLYVQRDWF